jgi:diguanylate cyclase (GGDEF)-like protein/PAS domain S-box-containing protein
MNASLSPLLMYLDQHHAPWCLVSLNTLTITHTSDHFDQLNLPSNFLIELSSVLMQQQFVMMEVKFPRLDRSGDAFFECTIQPIADNQSLVSFHSIAYKKLTEQALLKTLEVQNILFNNGLFGFLIVSNNRVVNANQHAAIKLGLQERQLIGFELSQLFNNTSNNDELEMHKKRLALAHHQPIEIQLITMSHQHHWFQLSITSIELNSLSSGELWTLEDIHARKEAELELHLIKNDLEQLVQARTQQLNHIVGDLEYEIKERKLAEQQINQLAIRDSLTGLFNRRGLTQQLGLSLVEASENGMLTAILFLDLDRFKVVNDSMGHQFGDALLVQIAERLRTSIRAIDHIARLGGDEFVIIINHLFSEDEAIVHIHHIQQAFDLPFEIDYRTITISSSLGLSLYPRDGADGPTLLKYADMAMYQAKMQGRNTYRVFQASLVQKADNRMLIEQNMKQALKRNEFELMFQPKMSIDGLQLEGAEVLLRWNNSERGYIAPDYFIPIAEEIGFIDELGAWVIEQSAIQLNHWRKAGLVLPSLSINLSPRQLTGLYLQQSVMNALANQADHQTLLEFELTESALMNNHDEAGQALDVLRELGIRLSIDDFGTGYSNLRHLKAFAIDTLKIDRSFIRDIHSDPDDAKIVETIINLARNLNLKVVAEGVETLEQLEYLRQLGCDEIQGYYFSKPLSPIDFVTYSRQFKTRAL